MAGRELDPLAPREALDCSLEHHQDELRQATQRTHRSALSIFCDWTDEVELTNLNGLSGSDLVAFRTWRKAETDVDTVSLNGTFAVLQRFCASVRPSKPSRRTWPRRSRSRTCRPTRSGATIRRDFYKLSWPCEYGWDCPHDRDISACDATRNTEASDCPSSFSTHPLRKWSIMSQLDDGVQDNRDRVPLFPQVATEEVHGPAFTDPFQS